MKSKIFKIRRFGVVLYARSFADCEYFLTPTISADYIKGVDRYFDLEIKFLCFGVGVRFIWITKK